MESCDFQIHKPRERDWGGGARAAAILTISLMGALCSPGALISSFPAGDSSWQLGTLAVGNLDDSPDLEIVVPYRDSSGHWFLDAFKYTGQRLPGFPYASGGEALNTSPTLYDLNHDGRNEILFTRGNHVIALRGDGAILWSNTVDNASYVPDGGYQTVTGGFYWYPGPWLVSCQDRGRFGGASCFSEGAGPLEGFFVPEPAGGLQSRGIDQFGEGSLRSAGSNTWPRTRMSRTCAGSKPRVGEPVVLV
jgi:hypothetical protein